MWYNRLTRLASPAGMQHKAATLYAHLLQQVGFALTPLLPLGSDLPPLGVLTDRLSLFQACQADLPKSIETGASQRQPSLSRIV
jgi:hypothetical protein